MTLNKYTMKVWTGFKWLAGSYEYGKNQSSEKGVEFLDHVNDTQKGLCPIRRIVVVMG